MQPFQNTKRDFERTWNRLEVTRKRPLFALVGSGSYLNRGCEALIRGTVKTLRHAFDNPRFVNGYFNKAEPPARSAEHDPDIVHESIYWPKKWSSKWIVGQVLRRTWPRLGRSLYFGSLKDYLLESEAVLAIGGDNYTLDYCVPKHYLDLDRYVLQHKRPLVIWGASIGPFDKAPNFAKVMHEHLRNHVTAIFVREEISKEYLAMHGIAENVYVMSDPAFLMEPVPVSEDRLGFPIPDGAIGLNLSPLIAKFATGGDIQSWRQLAANIMRQLLKRLKRPILLVPHVTSPHSNDHTFLSNLQIMCPEESKDIYMVPDYLSAAETKWVISRLACLVGARTHATIASFSTFVPTVCLAYSVKTYGINRKLFGHTDFVVSPEVLTVDSVCDKTKFVLNESGKIARHLREAMNQVENEVLDAGTILRDILEDQLRAPEG